MTLSLRTKLLVWNSCVFTIAVCAFGALQILVTRQAALTSLDRELRGRSQNVLHGPGGPPPDRPQMDARGPGPRQFDVRRPRLFFLDGTPVNPETSESAWSETLLKASAEGRSGFEDRTVNSQQLRVFSRPFTRPDGSKLIVQVAQETDSLRIAERAQFKAFVVVLPLVAIVSWILAVLLSRLVTKPVSRLTAAAEQIAADPELKDRIDVESDDEMGRLSHAFNAMTDRLQGSNFELKEGLEAQKRFTGDAAHELRTPLTSISLAAENALHREATLSDKDASLKTILRSSQTMQKLTSMLLSLSKLDKSNFALAIEATDIVSVVETAVSATGLAQDTRLRLDLPASAIVNANSDALQQIIINLLENAMAYTPADGAITLEFVSDTLTVADTGEGIEADKLPYIFDRFYRADPARSRAKGGYGLGLSICKSLADGQGLDLSVTSEIGKGTTFSIKFHGTAHSS